MDFIDLVFDYDYFDHLIVSSEKLDWPEALELYKNEYAVKCIAPNKHCAAYEKPPRESQCRVTDWLQTVTKKFYDRKFIPYLYTKNDYQYNRQIFENNLANLARYSPDSLEDILSFTNVDDNSAVARTQVPVLHAIDNNIGAKLSEKSIDYLEKLLLKRSDMAFIKPAASIITNYVIHYAKDSKYSDFLTDLIKNPDSDENMKECIFGKLTQDIRLLESWDDRDLLDRFAQLLPYDTDSHILAKGLFEAHKRHNYSANIDNIALFEKLLDVGMIKEAAASFLGASLEKLLLAGNDIDIIEHHTTNLLDKNGKLSHGLVDAIFERYKGNQDHFTRLIVDLVAEDKLLPVALLSKLSDTVVKIQDPKVGLFIATRMSQHHIALDEDVLGYFVKYLEDQDDNIRALAINLYDKIDELPQNIKLLVKDTLVKLCDHSSNSECWRIHGILKKIGAKESIDIDNRILHEESLEGFLNKNAEAKIHYKEVLLKLSASDGKALARSMGNLINDCHWSADFLLNLLHNIEAELLTDIVVVLEKLSDYRIDPEVIDRDGIRAFDVLNYFEIEESLQAVNRIIRDDRFYIEKDKESLFEELRAANPEKLEIIDFIYIQLAKLEEIKSALSEWDHDDFIEWRQSIDTVDDDNIAAVMAVISQAACNSLFNGESYPRLVQIISTILLFKSQNGGLAQIATGEGKSLIVASLAIIKVLQGRKVDIVTSSSVLAVRDVMESQGFYGQFGISVDHNIQEYGPDQAKDCYLADVVYGDLLHFIGDTLRDISQDIKLGRGFDVVIVDEVDNMFIDQTKMKVQLSSAVSGFEFLTQVLVYIYGTHSMVFDRLIERSGLCYLKESILTDEQQENLEILLNPNKTKESIQDLDFDSIMDKTSKEQLFFVDTDCSEFIKNHITSYIKDKLFAFTEDRSSRMVVIPKHLEKFSEDQIDSWLNSILSSYIQKEKLEYVVSTPPAERSRYQFPIIVPLDYENTGVIQYGLQWSDGLHQFLQIKHSLAMYPENVVSIFMSYFGFFSKYKGNIYGVSGTLGDSAHHNFLQKVYDVNLSIIPTFIEKDLVEFHSMAVVDKAQWQQEIMDVIKRKIEKSRACLIILKTIKEVEDVKQYLQNSGYDADHIFVYGTIKSDSEYPVSSKRELKIGDIIIATNMAGRGTDLKISAEVKKNGGLHVIMGDMSDSVRIQHQGYGRAARQGESGSAQTIVNIENILDTVCQDDLECLLDERDINEAERLKYDRLIDLEYLKIRDELFDLYVELRKEVDSPTNYKIILGKPQKLELKTIYLYSENGTIFLKMIRDQKDFDRSLQIGDLLTIIDPNAANHIKTILSEGVASSSSLNKQDFEIINFIAASNGYSDYLRIYERVQHALDEEVKRHSRKDSYLFNLLHNYTEFKDLDNGNETD